MSSGQLVYGAFLSSLFAIVQIYRIYSLSVDNYMENWKHFMLLGLIISGLNMIVFWFLRKIVLYFEINSIKILANILLGITIASFLNDLIMYFGGSQYGIRLDRINVIILILNLVFYFKILISSRENLKLLKIYSGFIFFLSLMNLFVTRLLLFGGEFMSIISSLMTIIYILSALLLPLVFYIEYKRQDTADRDDNEVLDYLK